MRKQSKIINVIISVTGLIVLSKILGFLKQMVVAATYGATIETDIINLAQGFVGDMQYIITQSILASFVSMYIYIKQEDEEKVKRFATQTTLILVAATIIISVCIFIFSQPISGILAPSYNYDLKNKLAQYIRLYAPFLICFALISSFHALLNANEKFIPGQLESLIQSVVVIGFVIAVGAKVGPKTLLYSFCTYTVLNVIFLGILAKKYFWFQKLDNLVSTEVKELLKMIGPLFISYSMLYVNQMIDKILVSGQEKGAITALSYAAVLANLMGTVITTITSVFFTYITQDISSGNIDKFSSRVTKMTISMLLIFLPISIITIISSNDIVSIVYQRGAFNQKSVRLTSFALKGYGFFFFPMVFRELYSRIHYGFKDSKTPMINSFIGIIINIVMSVVLCRFFGVFGVALATSISVIVCGFLNFITVKKHRISVKIIQQRNGFINLIISGVLCLATCMLGNLILSGVSPLIRFILECVFSLLIYTIALIPIIRRLFIHKGGI